MRSLSRHSVLATADEGEHFFKLAPDKDQGRVIGFAAYIFGRTPTTCRPTAILPAYAAAGIAPSEAPAG
jgi:hypothetical protein